MSNLDSVIEKPITNILSGSFMDYSMSVIVSRAIPDVRDGLKPVHRRILYSMHDLNMYKQYKKSARIVGDVIGKYHPHGDSAVYETMVRMSQPWSLREPLIDGHGNFGSMDGDAAAAMRYTEAKLEKISVEMLRDLNKNTVDFQENYDGTEHEPAVLPSRFPNLLVNGSEGIAVGMATKIPPHNLKESCQAIIAQIDNETISTEELMKHLPGPDFPTGGTIMGDEGIKEAYETGRGSIPVRGVTEIKETQKGTKITIKEIPYQVNKAKLVSDIKQIQKDWDEYAKERNKKNSKAKVKGLDFVVKNGVLDETDRNNTNNSVTITIRLKKGVEPDLVLNHLYKHTQLQTSFSVNNLSLVPKMQNGKRTLEPRVLNLKETINEYIKHQIEVITRRLTFELKQKEEKIHLINGLIKALDQLDAAIQTIRNSSGKSEARESLIALLSIDETQANHILEMKLQKLTSGDQEKEREEQKTLKNEIDEIRAILKDDNKIKNIIKDDLFEIGERYGSDRRTAIKPPAEAFNAEDLIADDDVVVTITQNGFIKRTLESTYRTQRRKGIGVNAMSMYKDDFIRHLEIASNHDNLLFFTNHGKVYRKKVHEIPESTAQSRGDHIQLLLNLEDDESIQAVLSIRTFTDKQNLVFVTRNGIVKKSLLSDYENIRSTGIHAINLDRGDRLIGTSLTTGKRNITLVTKKAMSITFKESDVELRKRKAKGVKGIDLSKDDGVVSFVIHDGFSDLFLATERGYGKCSSLSQYRVQNRNGKGVKSIRLSDKTGDVIGANIVEDNDATMLMTKNGTLMKMSSDEIAKSGRKTQGTRLIRLRDNDSLRAIAAIPDTDLE